MPTTFWNSWQLWEKMCFVLGSSIVVVIFLGCLKLMYNHWRLRKYTAIAATKAAIRQEMQHSGSVKRGRAREIPFGVRAIESGVEVEGVWISGSNTPANSIPGSPELSATTPRHKLAQEDSSANQASSTSNMTRIEIPQPVHRHPEIILPSGNPFGNHNLAFEGAAPSERYQSRPSSSDQHSRGRPTYQPRRSSHLRYSNSFDPENADALATLEGNHMAAESNGKWPEGFDSETEDHGHPASSSASSSSGGHNDSSPASQSALSSNGLLHPAYQKPPKTNNLATYQQSDLESPTDTHESHINEDGHLLVRNRTNGMTAIFSSANDPVSTKPPLPEYGPRDPFISPVLTPGVDHITIMHLDIDTVDHHAQQVSHDDVVSTDDDAQPLQPFDANRQRRQSQVVRKVNSGFEILRPGSFDVPRQSNDSTEWNKVSGMGNKRQPRRLRRQRTSSGSQSIEMV